MEFRNEDLELAAANSLAGEKKKFRSRGARSSIDSPVDVFGESKAPVKIAVHLDASTYHESGETTASKGVSSSSSDDRNAAPMSASTSSGGQTATSSGPSVVPNIPEFVDPFAASKKARAMNFFNKCSDFWLQFSPVQDVPFKIRQWQAQQMYIENQLRNKALFHDISVPEEDVRLSALRCEGMQMFSIVKREHMQEGYVIADVDPPQWFKVVDGFPNNIKDSLVNVLIPSSIDKGKIVHGKLCQF